MYESCSHFDSLPLICYLTLTQARKLIALDVARNTTEALDGTQGISRGQERLQMLLQRWAADAARASRRPLVYKQGLESLAAPLLWLCKEHRDAASADAVADAPASATPREANANADALLLLNGVVGNFVAGYYCAGQLGSRYLRAQLEVAGGLMAWWDPQVRRRLPLHILCESFSQKKLCDSLPLTSVTRTGASRALHCLVIVCAISSDICCHTVCLSRLLRAPPP